MHHAYLYEGSQELLPALARSVQKEFGFVGEHNPDVRVLSYEKFGIEDAGRLKEDSLLRSLSGRALVVVGIGSITTEAQHALLKLFEEPQRGLIFVLLTPHGALVPTLRSRFILYPHMHAVSGGESVKKFLSSSTKERSSEIAELLKEEEGSRERVRDFLNSLENALLPKLSKSADVRTALEDIAHIRSYVNDRSPSLKMLLEHLALSIPQF